ncbi:MAG: acetate/propionate family kinase [Planctomycetota bacterium]
MIVLALNSGSSSLKFKLVECAADGNSETRTHPLVRMSGSVEKIGGEAILTIAGSDKTLAKSNRNTPTHREAVQWILATLEETSRTLGRPLQVHAIGHRVVHGGERFIQPVKIEQSVVDVIDELAELAPLHNPDCLAGIRSAREVFGADVPMVAVFDTAFHRSMPRVASTYAIDLDLAEKHGIRRYGFHGIAHASLADGCAAVIHRPLSQLRLITLQLGNGCSAAAIRHGRSVDTSMGFTPLEGLVMGTRSGDLDPAVVAYLVRKEELSVEEVERVLNERAGLLGVSGVSRDMRELLQVAENRPDSRAALAVELFCYRVRKYIGAYLAVLGGADALVFGGGIGERSAIVRARICEGMEWSGLQLDPTRNEAAVDLAPGSAMKISRDGTSPACYVVSVDEEVEIARATVDCLRKKVP